MTRCGPRRPRKSTTPSPRRSGIGGVWVHYFGQLLGETLELPEGRAFVLDRICTPEGLGPNLIAPLRSLFDDLDGPALAEFLVWGVLKADLHPARAHSLKWDLTRADDFVLPPCRVLPQNSGPGPGIG